MTDREKIEQLKAAVRDELTRMDFHLTEMMSIGEQICSLGATLTDHSLKAYRARGRAAAHLKAAELTGEESAEVDGAPPAGKDQGRA